MRRLKNSVFRLQSRIASLKKALTALIDDDEIMAMMNLTRLRGNPELYRFSFLFQRRTLVMHWSEELLVKSLHTLPLQNVTLGTFCRSPISPEFLQSHEEIEELLESHLMDCNSLAEKIVYLLVTIQNAEDLVRFEILLIFNSVFYAKISI